MVIPNWLKPYLSDFEISDIEKHIAAIELKTEAEIIPVVVRSSSAYRQSSVTLMLIAAVLFVILWEALSVHFYWDSWLQGSLFLLFGLLFVFALAPRFARFEWIRRLVTVRAEELEQCWKRARLEFYENRLDQTTDSVGVLIYVSLLEHVVIVLADQKIAGTLPEKTWQKVVDQIVLGIKNKKMAEGFKKGLSECSNLLIEHFPVKSGDVNELPNQVVVKE